MGLTISGRECRRLTLPISAMLMIVAAAPTGPVLARPDSSHHSVMLPDRLLRCRIGHVTNFDPSREQTAAELHYDRQHDFALFLPATAVRTGPPPEPFEKPEPVDPRTRIVSDPDRIAPQPGHRFDKVVDYWPDRVELASTIAGSLLNVIVIHPIDAAKGTGNLFMTRASELTHFDAAHIYQGSCVVQRASRGPT